MTILLFELTNYFFYNQIGFTSSRSYNDDTNLTEDKFIIINVFHSTNKKVRCLSWLNY